MKCNRPTTWLSTAARLVGMYLRLNSGSGIYGWRAIGRPLMVIYQDPPTSLSVVSIRVWVGLGAVLSIDSWKRWPRLMEQMLEQFSEAFEVIPAALLVVDHDGRIVLANADLQKLFGYEAGELVGESLEILVPEAMSDGHSELREGYHADPHRHTMGSGRDLFGVSKSGQLIPVEIGLSSVQGGTGTYSLASVVDISPRIAAQQRIHNALDAAASGMILVDGLGTIVLANKAAHRIFGAEAGGLLGVGIEELIPGRFRRRHEAYRSNYAAAEPTDRSMDTRQHMFGRRIDGVEFPVDVGLTPINEDGERTIMATIMDISERVRSQEEIRHKNEELTRLNGELTQFTYSASHDLKAPLTTLDGLLGCLAEDAAAGAMDEVLLNADRAQVLARRLAGLIESTLGLAQSESLASDAERIDLAEMVDEVRQTLDGALSAYDVELHNEIPIGCELVVQSIRLRQILENLISNAAKYSDCSKNGSFVRISIERDLDCHKITVADNGVGIPEQSHADVFKRFRRFGDQSIDGAGVGLALVKQHVVRMKGEITFESTPEGTAFVIALPQAAGIW